MPDSSCHPSLNPNFPTLWQEFVITGNDDGTIRLWNPDSGSTISLHGHTNTVTSLDVAVRGSTELLLSAGFDAHVGVWDITKRKNTMPRLEHIFRAHSEEVPPSEFPPATPLPSSSSQTLRFLPSALPTGCRFAQVLCLISNPMNSTFITGGNDKKLHIYSLGSVTSTSFPRLAVLEGHKEPVTCLALDGNFLLSGSEDGVVCVWELHSYMHLGSLSIHNAPVEAMLVVPENGLLISCSTDSTVRVWDYGSAEQVQVWRHHEEFRCVALRRATGHVLAGTEQANIVAFPLSDLSARSSQGAPLARSSKDGDGGAGTAAPGLAPAP